MRPVLFRSAPIARSMSLVIGSQYTNEFLGPPIWQLGHRTAFRLEPMNRFSLSVARPRAVSWLVISLVLR